MNRLCIRRTNLSSDDESDDDDDSDKTAAVAGGGVGFFFVSLTSDEDIVGMTSEAGELDLAWSCRETESIILMFLKHISFKNTLKPDTSRDSLSLHISRS